MLSDKAARREATTSIPTLLHQSATGPYPSQCLPCVSKMRDQQRETNGGRPLAGRHPLFDALLESETRYRTIFESGPACVKLVDHDGTLLSMNAAGLEMVGARTQEELIGLSVYDLIVPEDRERFVAMNERVFEGERAHLEFSIQSENGQIRHMESFAAPLRDTGGAIVAQLAVSHDISERKRNDDELAAYRERLETLVEERSRELEASRDEARRNEQLAALGTLAAGLAHELNNPLGTILLGIEMAATAASPEEQEEALASIRRDVSRCSHIVRSMLRFGRGEAAERKPVSLNHVARRARDDARAMESSQTYSIDLDLASDLPLVLGNETELGQVLLNLIQNAANASAPGARITVETRHLDGTVDCRVRDRGLGMPAEVLSQARDVFFTTRLNDGGTGLGLSVSHGIVTAHGGALSIESEEAVGTTVTFSIPAIGVDDVVA